MQETSRHKQVAGVVGFAGSVWFSQLKIAIVPMTATVKLGQHQGVHLGDLKLTGFAPVPVPTPFRGIRNEDYC